MVILKNIRRIENEIEADYYPEGGAEKYHMKINFQTGDVLEHDGKGYSMSPSHVRNELMRLSEKEELPESKTVIWY